MSTFDPGPVPAEPERFERVIVVDPYTAVVVTAVDGLVGLAIRQAGNLAAAGLNAPATDAVLEALAAASTPEPHPPLPTVEVIR